MAIRADVAAGFDNIADEIGVTKDDLMEGLDLLLQFIYKARQPDSYLTKVDAIHHVCNTTLPEAAKLLIIYHLGELAERHSTKYNMS